MVDGSSESRSEIDTNPASLRGLKMEDYSVDDVGEWLAIVRMPQLAPSFSAAGINGKKLVTLTREQLRGLGVTTIGQRKKFEAQMQRWQISEVVRLENESNKLAASVKPDDERALAVGNLFKAYDCLLDAVVAIDESGIIVSFNPAAGKLFGYTKADMVGRPLHQLMPEPHRSNHQMYVSRYVRSGVARAMNMTRQVPILLANGTVCDAQLALSERKVGPVRYFVGVLRPELAGPHSGTSAEESSVSSCMTSLNNSQSLCGSLSYSGRRGSGSGLSSAGLQNRFGKQMVRLVRRLIYGLVSPAMVLDGEGTVVAANEPATSLFASNLTGRNISSLLHKDDVALVYSDKSSPLTSPSPSSGAAQLNTRSDAGSDAGTSQLVRARVAKGAFCDASMTVARTETDKGAPLLVVMLNPSRMQDSGSFVVKRSEVDQNGGSPPPLRKTASEPEGFARADSLLNTSVAEESSDESSDDTDSVRQEKAFFQVRAIQDYKGQSSKRELSFFKGEAFTCTEKRSSSEWIGHYKGIKGSFPPSHVELVE